MRGYGAPAFVPLVRDAPPFASSGLVVLPSCRPYLADPRARRITTRGADAGGPHRGAGAQRTSAPQRRCGLRDLEFITFRTAWRCLPPASPRAIAARTARRGRVRRARPPLTARGLRGLRASLVPSFPPRPPVAAAPGGRVLLPAPVLRPSRGMRDRGRGPRLPHPPHLPQASHSQQMTSLRMVSFTRWQRHPCDQPSPVICTHSRHSPHRLTNAVAVAFLGVPSDLIFNPWWAVADYTVNAFLSPYNLTMLAFFALSLPAVFAVRSLAGALATLTLRQEADRRIEEGGSLMVWPRAPQGGTQAVGVDVDAQGAGEGQKGEKEGQDGGKGEGQSEGSGDVKDGSGKGWVAAVRVRAGRAAVLTMFAAVPLPHCKSPPRRAHPRLHASPSHSSHPLRHRCRQSQPSGRQRCPCGVAWRWWRPYLHSTCCRSKHCRSSLSQRRGPSPAWLTSSSASRCVMRCATCYAWMPTVSPVFAPLLIT